MSQVFKNAARTELDTGISALSTQFTVIDGTIFPEATASEAGGVINQTSGDWFKLVLQDDDGNFEIVYCYGHGYMTHTFTVLRGQEGTTARAFLEGTTVGLRLLSSDLDTIHSTLTLLGETKQEKTAPAAKADALTNARTITLSGAVQANATWDASGALELVTDNIDVSKANGGTLVVGRGGTGTTTSTGSGSVVLNTSPALSGIPTAPTASAATNTTQLATTAFVQTATETRVASSEKGAANGVATLDATGKVPPTQLPSYVDDVLEFANLASFPATGESGKIYVALDTNKTYRWSGSAYVYITSGAVDSVAGKTGVVTLVKADVGLSNVDNTADSAKPVSAAQQTALDSKVDKVAGKGLSSNDFTDTERVKLANIAEQATKNATDAALRDRSTHTGTQPASTIANFVAEVRTVFPDSIQTGIDLKTLKRTGFYPVLSPVGAPSGTVGFLEVFTYTVDWVVQRYYDIGEPSLSWRRNFYNGDTWSPWILETNQINAARSIATGGIIESVANANGTYTKFADGTLICIGQVTTPAAAMSTGTNATWTLPTAFADGTYGLQHSTHTVISGGSIVSSGDIVANGVVVYKGADHCILNVYAYKFATDPVVFSLTAIGRWK